MAEDTNTEKSLDEAAQVRYLEPGSFALMRTTSGGLKLTLNDDRSFLRVRARRCFPFAFPSRYVSLRDGADQEIGIISDLASFPKEYKDWIEEDLEMRYYTPRVSSIESIRHRFGGVEWRVVTDRGPRRMITRGVHDTMMEVEIGRHIITDVDGNRYELFADALDEQSRAKLDRLI